MSSEITNPVHRADSDDSLSSSPIQLPLPRLPGHYASSREGASRFPPEYDYGSSPSQFTAPSQARRTPSPPLPSLISQEQTVSESWLEDRTPTAHHQPSESSYYTALWGSPYDLPAPSTIAGQRHSRFGSRPGTHSTEDSPLRPFQRRGVTYTTSASSQGDLLDIDHHPEGTLTRAQTDFGTSRFRGKLTEDWLRSHIAHRRRGEKKNWWSDESGEGSDGEQSAEKKSKRRGRKSDFEDTWLALRQARSRSRSPGQQASQQGSSKGPARRDIGSRFHRPIASDATLTQAQFDGLNGDESDDLPDINMLAAVSQGMQGMLPRRQQSISQSRDISHTDKPLPPEPFNRTASESPVGATRNTSEQNVTGAKPIASSIPFQRTKKKVGWRGKTCVIALPLEDGKDEKGRKKVYLSAEQVSDLMRSWEQKGFQTRGFDLVGAGDDFIDLRGQSRDIYPDTSQWRNEFRNRDFNIKVPDRASWEVYVRELQEAKLRALGVLKDKPEELAGQSPVTSQPQMSRTASSQTSRALTASVNGFRGQHGEATFSPSSFTSPDGVLSRQSMISPISNPASFHAAKQSIAFIPGQGFVNLQFPLPQPTPPPGLSQQQPFRSQPPSRGPSPAITDGRRMSIRTPQPQGFAQLANDSAALRQQQQQLQQAMMQGRQMHQPHKPDPQQALTANLEMNTRAVHSQPIHIASPMPQTHRHNVSESLQREIEEAEQHLEKSIRHQLEDHEGQARGSALTVVDRQEQQAEPRPEKIEASLQGNNRITSSPHAKSALPARTTSQQEHARKPSTSKLRADVPEFVFDPSKSFMPSSVFNFGQPAMQQAAPPAQRSATFQAGKSAPGHSKNSSISSTLNVAASAFVPLGGKNEAKFQIPESQSKGFSFSSSVPGINPDARVFMPGGSLRESTSPAPATSGIDSSTSKIFGNYYHSELAKPEKRSKAVPIVKPATPVEVEQEDENGRVNRDEATRKKARKGSADGDQAPQFATPTPEPTFADQMAIAQRQIKEATPEPASLPTPPLELDKMSQDSQVSNKGLESESTKPVKDAAVIVAVADETPNQSTGQSSGRQLSPSVQLGHELQMPKVDTSIATSETANESIDWSETPLEGPFSRQSLESRSAKQTEEASIAGESSEIVKAEPPKETAGTSREAVNDEATENVTEPLEKSKLTPTAKPFSFNPAKSTFNPAASAFNPSAPIFNPAATNFTPMNVASALPPSVPVAEAVSKAQSFVPEAEAATPEQEWPENMEKIAKPPSKLGVQSRQTSGTPKNGLGGGLLGTSRWAAPTSTSPKDPAQGTPKDSLSEPSPASRGRKTKPAREASPAPATAPRRTPSRNPSPALEDYRRGFQFSTFGDRLATAKEAPQPPRDLSPPVRGRGKKGSATHALSRSPSPMHNDPRKGFAFSTFREHQFAAPKSPPLPPKSPSLAYSPPPQSPTPPIPARSPSRRREDDAIAVPKLKSPSQDERSSDLESGSVKVPEPLTSLRQGSLSLADRPSLARSPSPSLLKPELLHLESCIREGVSYVQPSPTYQEIDDVIRQLNGSDSDRGIERTPQVLSRATSQLRSKGPSPEALISLSPVRDTLPASPVRPTSDPNDLTTPFQYLPPDHEYGSSGSAAAELVARSARFSPSFKPSRRDDAGLSPIRNMGHIAHRESVSDWNDVLSSSDEAKFHARTHFFDHKVEDVIGDAIQTRLRPLEQGLALLNKSLEEMQRTRRDSRRRRRSLSAEIHSDADDEDDEAQHSTSPVKDRRLEKIKAAVLEVVNSQQKAIQPELEQVLQMVAEMKVQMAEPLAKSSVTKDIDAAIEQAISRHMRGKSSAVMSSQDAATAEKLKLHVTGLESMLRAADQRAADEQRAREMAEAAVQGNQDLLRAAQDEAEAHKEAAEETERSLRSFLDAQQESKQRMAMLEEAEEAMQNKILNLSSKNEALEDTLEEYRLSHADMKKEIEMLRAEKQKMSDDWNSDIEMGRAENEELQRTIENMRAELEEGLQSRQSLKDKFDKLCEDMSEAARNVTRDQANWRQKEDEHHAKHELQAARLEAEARTRERLELEIDRLEKQEKEAMRARFLVEQIRGENIHLGGLVNELRAKSHEYQDQAAAARREVDDVKQRAQTEIQRMNKMMNAEAETSRSQAQIIRQELQAVILRLEQQLDHVKQDVENSKTRYQEMLDEASESKDKALREAAEARDAALQEHYRFHERTLDEAKKSHEIALAAVVEDHRRAYEELQARQTHDLEDLQMEHERAMRYTKDDQKRLLDSALEDKRMTENYLNGRLALADEKIAYQQDRLSHLEERLEIAKSAAQAAADAAQVAKKEATMVKPRASLTSQGRPSMAFSNTGEPDKISPQALRESIAVLQEQLHARESKIEELEQELEPLRPLPEKVKEKDMEINFVRELLDVRMDDLQDIIRTLSQRQGFSRERVRDAVIRLRANLQMEQQEKERAIAQGRSMNSPAPPNLSLSGLKDMAASPRNVGLAAAAAWGNWRRGQSSLAEMAAPMTSSGSSKDLPSTSQTPSRTSPQSFLSGLLTPPATNVRAQTPTPAGHARDDLRRMSSATNQSSSRPLGGYSTPKHQQRPSLARAVGEDNRHDMLSELPQPDTPPGLLNKGSYDQDAESGVYSLERYVNEQEEQEQGRGDHEDGSRMDGETANEAVATVDEPFGPVIGA